MLPLRRWRRVRYDSARAVTRRAAPTATSPCTTYDVDWAFELPPRIWPKPPSDPWLRIR